MRRSVRMYDYNFNVRLGEITSAINEVKSDIDILKKTVKSEDDLWDGSDLVRNWKISERTLASWRSRGMISYVQVNGKIWYPKDARESFLKDNQIPVQYKNGGQIYES